MAVLQGAATGQNPNAPVVSGFRERFIYMPMRMAEYQVLHAHRPDLVFDVHPAERLVHAA